MVADVEPMFIGADYVANCVGCSKSKAYAIIKELSKQLKAENPKALVVAGKINRTYFLETVLQNQRG